jgi:hypothetical protein
MNAAGIAGAGDDTSAGHAAEAGRFGPALVKSLLAGAMEPAPVGAAQDELHRQPVHRVQIDILHRRGDEERVAQGERAGLAGKAEKAEVAVEPQRDAGLVDAGDVGRAEIDRLGEFLGSERAQHLAARRMEELVEPVRQIGDAGHLLAIERRARRCGDLLVQQGEGLAQIAVQPGALLDGAVALHLRQTRGLVDGIGADAGEDEHEDA